MKNTSGAEITTALQGIRHRLDTLASITPENNLIPGGPQEHYHQLVEEAYAALGPIETEVDALRAELAYQHTRLDNLETVCAACHAVLHLGINFREGLLSAFDCKPELTNMARIVYGTRVLVARKTRWPEIERQVLEHYALPGGHVYTCEETTMLANQMLKTIQPGEYRGYLPEGQAILFHHSPPWNGFPEEVHVWQLPR